MYPRKQLCTYLQPNTLTVGPGSLYFVLIAFWLTTLVNGRLQAQTSPATFTYTGSSQTFTVPTGVTSLTVVAKGAKGATGVGGATNGPGGKGGTVSAVLSVTPGQVLTLEVGGQGLTGPASTTGSYNGGGKLHSDAYPNASYSEGAGGGATDIRIGGTALANRVLVAGGGGGGSTYLPSKGGDGGGLIGQNGLPSSGNVGGGGGGTQSQGGSSTQNPGQLGVGGQGRSGGAGGGGYYGGGSGVAPFSGYAGGGGGSSYTDPTLCANVVHTQGDNDGDGSITLSWTAQVCSLTVNITPTPSLTVASGGSVTLTASGADTYTWSTGASTTAITLNNVTSATTISVTGTTGGCSATATVMTSVTADCGPQVQANALSITQTAILGPGNCSVKLIGNGYGTGYTITGPGGYVFSAVYRQVGNYTLNALDVRQPGTYTLKVSHLNACGQTSSDTMTYVVTGTACK